MHSSLCVYAVNSPDRLTFVLANVCCRVSCELENIKMFITASLLFFFSLISVDTPGNRLFDIFVSSTPGHYVLLSGATTLEQVKEKYWKANKPLEMFYSLRKQGSQHTTVTKLHTDK